MPYQKLGPNDKWQHDPVKINFDRGCFNIDENGFVTIRVNAEQDEYDEVKVPAALIFRISSMLKQTRRIVKR